MYTPDPSVYRFLASIVNVHHSDKDQHIINTAGQKRNLWLIKHDLPRSVHNVYEINNDRRRRCRDENNEIAENEKGGEWKKKERKKETGDREIEKWKEKIDSSI